MTAQQEPNRRGSSRLPAHLIVAVQPVNTRREPIGPQLDAVSIDLSQGGVSFVSDHPLLADLAIVELCAAASAAKVSLLSERVRCRRVGGMFQIAVRFIEKLAP